MESHYFQHDYDATQDPKMMRLLAVCGLMGIGAYWVIIEILHQQECGGIGRPLVSNYISVYGKQGMWNQETLDKIEKTLFETGLLIERDGVVYSNRVLNNIKRRVELSNQGKINAMKRWGGNGTPLATQCDPNAIKEKKRKEKEERKKKETYAFEKPSLEEIRQFAKERNREDLTEAFFDFYESKGWIVGKVSMKNWRAAFRRAEKWQNAEIKREVDPWTQEVLKKREQTKELLSQR